VPGNPGRMWVVGGRSSAPGYGGDSPPYAPGEHYDVAPLVLPTMHVGAITGYFALDPLGRTLLRVHVRIVDQESSPLGDVAVKALMTPPAGEPAVRTRYTKPSGYARFHWGCNGCAGAWTLCVDEVGKAGYVYDPEQNVVTCGEWENQSP